jgi:dihydroorotate dehydrogenase
LVEVGVKRVSKPSPYGLLFDQVFTRTDPERIHQAAFRAIRAAGPVTNRFRQPGGTVRAMGLEFPGLLGLAAGFDKQGVGIDALAGLGFAFVEIGTITGRPQPGNPKPRLARLPADRAIVNRMGFNNDGAEVVARRLAKRASGFDRLNQRERANQRRRPVLGINIGKSKVVAEEDAIADYELSTGLLAPYADYLVVNVSSPNTPGLRNLQAVEKLEPLLAAVRRRADEAAGRHVPLLVKIAPDLDDDDVRAVADLAVAQHLDGIVATNTTIGRGGLTSSPTQVEAAGGGGLSGAPLRARANEVVTLLRGRVGHRMTLIGVGGITTVDDARERLDAGADLLQGYSAFIYEGPLWARRMNKALAQDRRKA